LKGNVKTLSNEKESNLKVMDVYSQLSINEATPEVLERIFLDSVSGIKNDLYKVFFHEEEVKLSYLQTQIVKEIAGTREIAFISLNKNVIAIIGYKTFNA